MQIIKLVIITIMLFQLVVLFGLWVHSNYISVIQKMTGFSSVKSHYTDQRFEPDCNKPQNATTTCCPKSSPHLVGPFHVEFNWDRTMESVWTELSSTLLEGGRYKPPDCFSLHKVAIIIPFRNRYRHLIQWLHYVHPMLQRQQLNYGVYVINQDGDGTFNRAKLMNIGFAEAMKDGYDCFVFTDVDLIPINDRNIYGCFSKPRHLSVAIDKFNFMLPYANIFGGAVTFSKYQYLAINGFPNEYWGWGGEDDDIFQRTAMTFLTISRPDMKTGRFKMIRHDADLHNDPNPRRFELIKKTRLTMVQDGYTSLKYDVKKVEKDRLYTFITVDVGTPPLVEPTRLLQSTTTN